MDKSIYALANEISEDFRNDKNIVDVVEGLPVQTYDILRTAEFMSSQHYINGDYDENEELIPFHDIITRILQNQRAAEEVDTADMKVTTDDPDFYRRAMLVDKYNQDWLAHNRIDKFINDAIETRGKYGGVLVKVVEEKDNIGLEVVNWHDYTGDSADLAHGLRCIEHYYTPAKLIEIAKERGWDLDKAKQIIEDYAEENQNAQNQDIIKQTNAKYVLVREVSGVLPKQYMDEEADEFEYSYQIHYVAGTELKDADGNEKGVTLYAGELEKSPYYYLPYNKRGNKDTLLGIGMVEICKHSQVQTNRAAQQYKKSLDLASTHVLQSTDSTLKGKNIIRGIKTGTVVHVKDGGQMSGVDMSPQALAHLDRFMAGLQNQIDRATGTFAVSTGENLPSGTPYRLGAILDQNAQSQFDLKREEFGIFINHIYQEHVLPFLLKQIKNATKLNLKFNPDELAEIDNEIETKIADDQIISNYFDGVYKEAGLAMFEAVAEDRMAIMTGLDAELKKGKSRRTIVNDMKGDWREYWGECEGKLYIELTNERRKKGVILESVNNMLMQYLQFKPQLDADPEARKMFNELRFIAGLRPIDFTNTAPAQTQASAPSAEPMEEEQPIAQSARASQNI
jgi:hypothetical protein